MKLIYKICLIDLGLVLLLSALGSDSSTDFGFFMMLYGLAEVPIGLILLIFKKALGQGVLLAAGILLLIGFAVCSVSPSAMMH